MLVLDKHNKDLDMNTVYTNKSDIRYKYTIDGSHNMNTL